MIDYTNRCVIFMLMYVQVKKHLKRTNVQVIKPMCNSQKVLSNVVCYTRSAGDKTDLNQLRKLATDVIEAIAFAMQQSGYRIQNEFLTKQLDCTAIQTELVYDDRVRQKECDTTRYARPPVSWHSAEWNILKPKFDWVINFFSCERFAV